MKTHPMLFNTEMVKALLAGNKVQTRRPMKDQPLPCDAFGDFDFPCNKTETMVSINWLKKACSTDPTFINSVSPWEIGDLIYVRETYAIKPAMEYGELGDPVYKADGFYSADKWTPSIHMPRWASRLTLKVTGVRIERIQDISEQDAIAEGIRGYPFSPDDGWPTCNGYTHPQKDDGISQLHRKASGAFGSLWKSAYGDSWDKNDWVWVIDFEVIHQNVDHYLTQRENAA